MQLATDGAGYNPNIAPVAAPTAAPPLPIRAGEGSGAYRADWSVPSPSPGPSPVAPPAPAASPDPTLAARAAENALLADDVYHDTAVPPAGFRVAGAAELEHLGLSPEMLEQPGSSFRARVYATGTGDETRYVIAFRGSQTAEDWANNVQQGAGMNSASYAKALEIGKVVGRTDADVVFTGHSLGGGLASEAAIASGREADTFNAAGLAEGTVDAARAVAASAGREVAPVQAWHVRGEILTVLQNGGDRAIGTVGGMLFGGPLGGPIGAAVVDMPEAYGIHHVLPDVRPEGASWLEGLNPVSRHGMDWVLAGTAALH